MTTLRSLVEARIKSTVPEFKQVAGAADIKTLMTAAMAPPACYVYRDRNILSPNTMVNIVSQQRTEFIGLLVVTRNVQDARGAVNSDESEQLCDLIKAQLLGFEPSNSYSPMECVSGDLVLFRDGFHFWREVYQSQCLIRSI